jgi:DNA polymerase-1
LAVCFDKEKPTFRQQLYAGYQAQRPKMANDLVPQIVVVHDVLQKMGVAIFEVDGYEADDLIGTLAAKAFQRTEDRGQKTDSRKTDKSDDTEHPSSVSSAIRTQSSVVSPLGVIVVSGDRDMLQLVNSHVKVLAPIKGITEMILFDEKRVEEKYGIKPSQIIDYKALVGDASDNYPGVKGIGPKTAALLLKEHGSFENMYKAINSLPPKIAEKLATDAEQAALAKKLATIVTDAPITLNISDCLWANFNTEGLKEEFERLGFKSLIKRLQEKGRVEIKNIGGSKKKDNEQLGLL